MNPYEFEYDGFMLADGVTRSIISAKVFDNPDIRESDSDRGSIDGQYPGSDLYGGRTLELDIEVWGDATTFQPSYTGLMTSLRLRRAEGLLRFNLPGWPDLRMACKPRRVSGPFVDVKMDLYVATVKVQFRSTDPRLYWDAASSGLANLPTSTDGMSFPLAFPIDFGAISQSNLISATNAGSYETPWTATINGPITDPRIEHLQSGKTLSFKGTVNAGETLVVRSRPDSSVLLNGTATRYSWLVDPSQWFMLAPGPNEVKLYGTSSGAPTLVLEWRSAAV